MASRHPAGGVCGRGDPAPDDRQRHDRIGLGGGLAEPPRHGCGPFEESYDVDAGDGRREERGRREHSGVLLWPRRRDRSVCRNQEGGMARGVGRRGHHHRWRRDVPRGRIGRRGEQPHAVLRERLAARADLHHAPRVEQPVAGVWPERVEDSLDGVVIVVGAERPEPWSSAALMPGEVVVVRVAAGTQKEIDQGPVGPVADDDNAIDRLPHLPGDLEDPKQCAIAPAGLASGRAVGLEQPFRRRPARGGHLAANPLRPLDQPTPARVKVAVGRQHPGGRPVLDRIGRRPGAEDTHDGTGDRERRERTRGAECLAEYRVVGRRRGGRRRAVPSAFAAGVEMPLKWPPSRPTTGTCEYQGLLDEGPPSLPREETAA